MSQQEAESGANTLTRYGRAILWRIVCELVRRYPVALSVGERWIHTGQNRCIEVRHAKGQRRLLFDVPTPPGTSMGMIGYLSGEEALGPLGESSWQPILGDWDKAPDPRVVLDNLGRQLLLGPRKGIPATGAHAIAWRVIAAFMTQTITARRTWDLQAGISYDPYDGDIRRDRLVSGFPDAYQAARRLRTSSDPHAEMWFLVTDPTGLGAAADLSKASACFVPRAGRLWLAAADEVDLVTVFKKEGRKLWSTMVAGLRDLLD